MNPSLQHKLDPSLVGQPYSGPQQSRATPVCTLHRFVGQASVGPSRFQSDLSETFIEHAVGHLIEIHVHVVQ